MIELILLIFVASVALISVLAFDRIERDWLRAATMLAVLLIGYIAISGIEVWSKISSYRRGQIDALNGVIKYEKQTNSDGETVWVERKQ